jgi:hypothetical protein
MSDAQILAQRPVFRTAFGALPAPPQPRSRPCTDTRSAVAASSH